MEITADVILAPLGHPRTSAHFAAVARALGEEPEELDGYVVFSRAGLRYWAHEQTGIVMTACWPPSPETQTTLPFPHGLRADMGDLAARACLGTPTATPIGIDFYGGSLPHDVFDLADVTIQVAYDEACERIVGVLVGTAATLADLRARRAASEGANIRRAKGAPSAFDELVARIEAAPRRTAPLASIAALLEASPAADLARLLRAHSEHDHGHVEVGDYKLDDGVCDEPVPAEGASAGPWRVRDDRLCIGRTAGGDLWVVAWPPTGGDTTPVSLIVHDEDWFEQEDSESLELFFAGREELG